MQFKPTRLADAVLIEPGPARDERGYFMRTFCLVEFMRAGLETAYVQHSMSYTKRKGTLRGMHFQTPPHMETKVVTCLRGAIFDVIVDLRPKSRTFCKWQAFRLSSENRQMLYIPEGFAHGFQALTDDVEVGYLISELYAPHAASGIRYDDPVLGIAWPLPVTMLSQRDKDWPPYIPVKAPRARRRKSSGKRSVGPVSARAPVPAAGRIASKSRRRTASVADRGTKQTVTSRRTDHKPPAKPRAR